ncbi:MAG: chromosome segregation protein SMC [Deltaproteobacteria bacterium GWC2_42_11]|nr:MAG: chromosome segregation protein SMC [Deltaproteobacteria bacterium GWC2_42_11]HBO84106.1 chromosome segregation protein SMC [Deltaproteobacteria bacterium]
MKIKKIEMQGFKSFVDKTALHFPKGITAIVGPNGCGKSNIVDAIRWVLGEQNARHLRGKLMEDVIFTGSETRKPIGMAEVILTLSNEEGLAPAEYVNFTEIEVARKLFRSGESEYYINKVDARLRDVVELFTDTGIGTRAYSIVEQGQVGWLITAKPEERRIIFEEAAGINKYRHRKEAALRKLEATKENLTRVSDIISEVNRQLNSLNRQAKKAERYKILRDELKGIELFMAKEEYSRLKNNMEATENNLGSLKERDMEITSAISTKQSEIEDIRIKYLNEESLLKEIKSKAFSIVNSIQTSEQDIEISRIRAAELKKNEERLRQETEDLTAQNERVSGEIEDLNRNIADISVIINAGETQLSERENVLISVLEKLSQQDRDLKEKKALFADTAARLMQIRNSMQFYSREEELIKLKSERAEKEKNEIEALISSKGKAVDELSTKIREAEYKKQDIEKIEETVTGRIKALEQTLAQKDSEQKVIKENLTVTSSRLSTLKELERNFEGFKEGVKAIMQNRKDGIRDIVADIIETSSEYEKAVEAAVGEKLQYIIVDGQNDGILAVEYLRENAMGRGSFVPLNGINSTAPAPDASVANALPILNLVKVKEGYSHIADYLLGNVIVTDNLKSAVETWNTNAGNRTIVTMNGDVIDLHGVITGGTSGLKDSGILQKKREIKESSVLISDMEHKIAGLDAEINNIKKEMDDAQKVFETLKADRHSKDIELVNLDGVFKREESELNRLKERMNILEFETDEAKRHFSEICSKRGELVKEAESLEVSGSKTETFIKTIEEEVMVLLKEKESLQNIVTDIKVSLASSRERLDGMRLKETEKEEFIEKVSRQTDAKMLEIEKGGREISTHESNILKTQREIEELLKEKDAISREDVIKEETINALAQEIKSLEDRIRASKQELDVLRADINAASLALKEMELNITHLLARVEEKYHIHIDIHIPSEETKLMGDEAITARHEELKRQIESLGEVSMSALEEYAELERRQQFLLDQQSDLNKSVETLHKAINRINRTTRQRFRETFDAINTKFQEVFPVFFPGGRAELRLTDDGDILESGIDIAAQPSGKRLQNISLLSGGEKAMTATALIFSIFLIKPSPFCLLDEVDAPLDDANIGRFNEFLKEMTRKSQFLLITHNKGTMEIADTLFGITMEEAGVSKVVSVKLN